MFSQESVKDLIKVGERQLCDIFNVEKSIIYLLNKNKTKLVVYKEHSHLVEFPVTGLVGIFKKLKFSIK